MGKTGDNQKARAKAKSAQKKKWRDIKKPIDQCSAEEFMSMCLERMEELRFSPERVEVALQRGELMKLCQTLADHSLDYIERDKARFCMEEGIPALLVFSESEIKDIIHKWRAEDQLASGV